MERDAGMFRRAGRGGRMAQLVRADSGGQTLSRRTRRAATGRTRILGWARPRWDRRLGSGRGGSLPAGGREEVLQDGDDHGRVGDEGEDPHMAATRGAEQRQHLVDASEQHSPSDASRAGGASWLCIGGGLLRWTRARWARELSGGCLGVGSADVGDGGTEFGIRGQNPVVPVAVDAWGCDETS